MAKNRQKYNKYIAEGDKICKELLISKLADVQYIVGTEKWLKENQNHLKDEKLDCLVANISELKKISQLSTTSEVMVVANKTESKQDTVESFSLYLDGIQNPGNMGAILRIADWYGIQTIYVSGDCVDKYNPKVIQASMGSFLRITTLESELSVLKENNQFTLWGASLNGSIDYKPAENRNLLIIGNEGRGIRQKNLSLIDQEIKIDSRSSLGAESLNAAVATGIFCDRFLK